MRSFQMIFLFKSFFDFSLFLKFLSSGFDYLPFPSITVCNMNPIMQGKKNLTTRDMQEFLASIKPPESIHDHHKPHAPGYQVCNPTTHAFIKNEFL